MYLHSPLQHGHGADFREIADFNPFDGASGTRVATTSTTTGANLLVSGVASGGADAQRPEIRIRQGRTHRRRRLQAVRLGQVWSGKASQPAFLGGD